MVRDVRTNKRIEQERLFGIENNKLRWFFVTKKYQCTLFNLSIGWYEKISTFQLKGNWLHIVKSKKTKDTFTISDADYMKIINTFKEQNKHLL